MEVQVTMSDKEFDDFRNYRRDRNTYLIDVIEKLKKHVNNNKPGIGTVFYSIDDVLDASFRQTLDDLRGEK